MSRQKSKLPRRDSAYADKHPIADRKSRSQHRCRQLLIERLETRLLLANDLTIIDSWDKFTNLATPDSSTNPTTYTLDSGRKKVAIIAGLSGWNTGGLSFEINAGEVKIDGNVDIDTCPAGGSTTTTACGSIDIEAHKSIVVDPGATLNAKHTTDTGTDDDDGDITLHIKNDMAEIGNYLKVANQLEELIAIFDKQRVHLSIGDGVQIQGGEIDISTDSGNFQVDKAPWLTDQAHKIWKIYAAAKPLPSAVLGFPLAFQDWAPKSIIQVGSGAVDISSNADSGDFKLKITGPDGSTKKTDAVEWSATAANLENLINALGLTGVSVTVTGEGTLSSPWHINGLGVNNVQVVHDHTLKDSDGNSVDLDVRASTNNDPSITNAYIVGSQGVTIQADAYASAIGKAVNSTFLANWAGLTPAAYPKTSNLLGNTKDWAWSVGMFLTDPTASIDLHAAVVSSQQDISIATSADNKIGLTTKSAKNTGAGKTNTKASALSFALSEQKTTSTIFVDAETLISSDGAVTVTATGTNKNSTSATAAVYRDGTVGIAPAVSYGCGVFSSGCGRHEREGIATNVTVTIDGKITANVSQPGTVAANPAALNTTFSPAFDVNIPASKVTLAGNPSFQTGDAAVLANDLAASLPGLPAGLYFLIVHDHGDNSYDLQFAATADDALAGNYLPFGIPFPTLTNPATGLTVPLTLTATDNQQRSLILFGYDKGPDGDSPIFNDGDMVTFQASEGKFLGYQDPFGRLVPLTDGATYRVQIVESQSTTYPLTIELLNDTTGAPLDLFGGSYLESDSGVRYAISAIDTDTGQVDVRRQSLDSTGENVVYTLPLPGIAQGQKLVFHSGLSQDSASLQDGIAYWAIVDPNNPGTIQLAVNAAQAEAADPSVQDALAHLTAIFQGLQIPSNSDRTPSGLQENQTFTITLGSTTTTFVFNSSGNLSGSWPAGTVAVKLVTTSADDQAAEIVKAILQAKIGLQPSYEGNGVIAVGTQKNLAIQSSSALQLASVPVDIPIDNFESGVGLVFSENPNLVDNLRVIYHAVPGKPMGGLVDGGAYSVYNVNNSNYNPAVPQYILTLMNAVEISSAANSGSFALRITAPDGSTQTTSLLPWNVSADDLAAAINGLELAGVAVQVSGTGQSSTPWYIDGLNVDAVAVVNSSLKLDFTSVVPHIREAAPHIIMGSDASDGTFTLEVHGADGRQGITGDLPWNVTAAQLQSAIAGLNLPGVNATVEGAGTFDDPWLIQGLNPSQIVVDSSKLLLGQDPTNMQMTSLRQVVFYSGQTLDDAGGIAYAISGADRNNGTLTIQLTDTAPVVAADGSQLTSDGTGTAGVSFAEVLDGAFEFYSFAADGSFTLTVADSSGNTQTTSDLPYNATSDQVAAALNALAGVAVAVTGRGTIGSPWLVSGLSLDQVTADSNLLDYRGEATNPVAQATSAGAYRVWVDHAQDGTFTLTLHADGQDATTAALSFDISAGDLTSALRALAGVNAQVTGAGTSSDPWILHTWSQPIHGGDPLVFHDNWGMSSLGMIDGQTYYAIVLQQGLDPQEVTLQLAATPDDAANASADVEQARGNQHIDMRPYLPLDPAPPSWSPQNQQTLLGVPQLSDSQSSDSNPGITINATLSASNSVGSYANLGGFPLLSFATPGGRKIANRFQEVDKKLELSNKSWIEELIARDAGGANQKEVVGAAAVQWVSNNVQVIIGRTAEIGTNGALTISSDIKQSISAVSNAGLSKTTSHNEHSVIAVSFARTNVQNTSQALVSSDAVLSGGNGVDVKSNINYMAPKHWPLWNQITNVIPSYEQAKGYQIFKNVVNDLETAFKDIFLGDLAPLSGNFNTVANVGIARVGGKEDNNNEVMKWVLTGSFAYEIIHNDNLAQIADGAKVNVPGQIFTSYNPDDQTEHQFTVTLQPKWDGSSETQIVGFKADSADIKPHSQFQLSYQGHNTPWLDANASNEDVQKALEALTGMSDKDGRANVTVANTSQYEWKLTFINELFDKNAGQVTIKTRNIPKVSLIQKTSSIIPLGYGVSIAANTTTPQWGVAGQLYFSVPYMIHGLIYGGGGWNRVKQAWREGGPFRSAAKNAFGGSVSLLTMGGSTQALLGGPDYYSDTYGDANAADPTEVHYGTGSVGGLNIEATTNNGIVQVAEASANSTGFGFEGSVAYVAMGEPHSTVKPDDRRQKTYAKMISRNVQLIVKPLEGSTGDISVNATDNSFGWAISGAVMLGQTHGIGLSGSVVELTRDVQASIGSQYNHQQDDATGYLMDPYRTSAESTQQSGSEIHTNGFLTVTSHVGGTIVPLSLVGSGAVRGRGGAASLGVPPSGGGDYGASGNESEIAQLEKEIDDLKNADGIIGDDEIPARQKRLDELQSKSKENEDVPAKEKEQVPADEGDGSTGDSEVIENGQNSKKGKWGFFISGDFSAAFVTDQVYGYINLDGDIIGNGITLPDDKKTISSENSTNVNPGAGSFALQWDRSETKKSTSGFAGSVAWASVDSDVQAVIDGTSIVNMAVEMEAKNHKKIGSGAAGLQVDHPTGFDLQVAGSVVINSISNTTVASLRNSDLTNTVELDVRAYAKDKIFGLAGTAQVSLSPMKGKTVVGVGMSAVWNDTNNTTTAEIVNCPSITQSSGGTQVIAEDFTTSTSNSFGIQIEVTGGNTVEIGGMWTTNLLFPNTTAQITGSNLTNMNSSAVTPMKVSAVLAPILESFAGYLSLGISTEQKDLLAVGAGAAVVVTRIGHKKEDPKNNDDDTTEYQTLAQISGSTITAYNTVDIYALTGDLNSNTSQFVPDQDDSELNDSEKARVNMHATAIAGGVQGTSGDVSLGAMGTWVSARQQVHTKARVTGSSSILQSENGNHTDLQVTAVNQMTVQTDSGGGIVSLSAHSEGLSIAFGFAGSLYNSFNHTIATIDDSTVRVRNTKVSADLAPVIKNYAFGVAVSGSEGFAIGSSGASLHLNQADTAEAGISNTTLTTSGNLTITAEDDSFLQSKAWSGTLAFGGSEGAISAGGVGNHVTVHNDILAWVGSKPNVDRNTSDNPILTVYGTNTDTSALTVAGMMEVRATAGQTVKNETFAVAVAGSAEFALAASGAGATIEFANIVRAGINDVASVMVTGPVTVHAEILGVNSDDSVYDRRAYATVGDITGVGASYGASIGLSFGQITNDDFVVAQIENSTVTIGSDISGSSIEVSASDSRYMETKIWVTSIAIAIGGAVAGGHSFIYSQPNVIAEVGHSSQIKPKNDSHRSDLSVLATGQESVHAGIFGGVAGLVAIGDFIAEADKHGIVAAVLGTVGALNVRDLKVQALGDHNLDAHGWSLGGGALAISGDGHRLTYDEQIVAWAGGDIRIDNSTAKHVDPSVTTTIKAAGNGSLMATSSTKAYSNAGQKPTEDNHSGNWGGAALGFFHSHATYSPTISTQIINVDLIYGGDLYLLAHTDKGLSQSRAVTASDTGFGAEFTKAINTIEPNTSLTINNSRVQAAQNSSGTMSLLATNDMQYDTYAYTFAITTEIGGSGSRVFNTFQPIAKVNYFGTNTLISAGTVDVVSHNTWTRAPNAYDGKSGLFNEADIYNSSQGLGGGVFAWDASSVGGRTENHDAEINQYVGFDPGDNGEISGGTFTLAYAGKTTEALQHNASEEDVQEALEKLSFDASGTILKDHISVDRSFCLLSCNTGKLQWTITFKGGLGTQQVTIDTSNLQYSGQLTKIEYSDTLPWSYNGISAIDFGTSSTEIMASNATKPIDVNWLATQSVDIQEFASQKVVGLTGTAYAISTVALNLDNHIWLDQANVTLTSGINHFTSASAMDIEALSQTGVHKPLAGGGQSDAVIVLNSSNSYRDKKYDGVQNTGTKITANTITIMTGGNVSDWNAVQFPLASNFTPQISVVARTGTNGSSYLTNAVVNHFNTIEQNSTLDVVGDSGATSKIINIDESTSGSYSCYSNSEYPTGYWEKNSVVVLSNSYLKTSGIIQVGLLAFDVEVHDAGVMVNGKQFDWSAIDPANPVNYQNIVASSNDAIGSNYRPFVVGKSQTVKAALSEVMDSNSLNNFEQTYTVPQTELAYLLQQIEVPQPSIRIVADQIRGTGTVSAQVPKLNIQNKTSGWLILNGIASHTNRNAGKVMLLDSQGNPTTAPGLTIQSNPDPDKNIDVSVSPPNSSSAKPFMIVAGYLNAPSSDVTLTNNFGPIIELAPIRAASVTINVPNSAFAVYTPDAYFGTGGNSMLAFEDAAYANALDTNSSANPSANLPFLPGQTTSGIDPNYIAPAASDYVNRTNSSRIPQDASGPMHVIKPQLGQGITAAQIAIFAKTIDINAPLKVGKIEDFSVTLSSDLGTQFRNHQAAYESGSTSNPLLVIQYVCHDSPDVTATYDARNNQITLSSMTLSQSIRVLLDGQVISTVDGSMVQLLGGSGGTIQISNQTGIPLNLNNIDAGDANVRGTVEFRDTATQINTRYVYNSADEGISVFTAPRNQSYAATPDQTLNSQTIDYQPQRNTLFVNNQRQDIFKASATSSVFASDNPNWYPDSTWNFGDVFKSGFSDFRTVNSASISSDQKQLTLTTDGTGGTANAAWLEQRIDVTRSFMVSFRYEGSGDGDGIAFALQTAGTGAVGASGSGLGYSEIAGNKAAFMINLYDHKDGPHPGVKFDSNEDWDKAYNATSPVSVYYPMEVQLYYDASQLKWFAFLSDSNGSVHYVTHKDVDLASQFGSHPVFAGFTGSTGLKSSTQTVKNFLLVYDPQNVPATDHWEGDLVHVVDPQLSGFTGFGPAGYLTADSISADTITFANYDNYANRQRAAWYGQKISTDVDSLSVDFTYQASFQNPKIEGFDDFVPQSTAYASAITPGKITLTNGSQNIARAAWWGGEIGTKDDFEINFKYQTDAKVVQGFSNFAAPTNAANAAQITSNQVILTNGATSIARAAWNKEQVPINYGFTVNFTYQASGDRNADGIALVFQTQGTNAVGGSGGSLGYVGIAGNKAAYQINIFGGDNKTKGSNFVTNNSSGSYNNTRGFAGIGGVDFSIGSPIQVRLTYDPILKQIYESLTDLHNNNTYNHTYSNIDLSSVLGTSQAYIGFTGSSGGQTATQTVNDFSFQSNQADGIALVFQKQGTGAIGSGASGLGYVGIPGVKVAYQINLFGGDSHTIGSNFVTTNSSGTYNSTGSVNFASGHPIQVQLSYNSHAKQLTEKLTDLISNTTYTKTYSDINLAALLGSTAFVGFTGGSGAVTAVQSVQDFSLESFPDDGVALVFQSAGTQVSGSAEDGLGYVGISGPTAAYQINLKSNGLQGSKFVTTNTAGTYLSTGPVDFASRNPIHVQLNYNNALRQMTESLTDTVTGDRFSRTYHNIDLASVLGPTAYIGFTAPQGGIQRIQTVKDFSLGGTSKESGFKQHFAAHVLSEKTDYSITSYATDFNTWVRADHPIRVDFSGISTSNDLNVVSNASLILNGLIQVANTASLAATSGSITSTSTGSVIARNIGISAKGDEGFIGTIDNPVSVSQTKIGTKSGFVSANGISGVYLASPGDLSIGYVSTVAPTDSHDGPVVINASGDIVPYSSSSLIFAGKLSMTSGGSIGSIAKPLQVQLVPNVVLDGSTVAGLFDAQATGDISVYHFGDVRIGKVKTPGTVAITTHDGSILDGLTLDAFGLNNPELSPQIRSDIHDFITFPEPNLSEEWIDSLEAGVNAKYMQYWKLIPVVNFPVQPPLWNSWDPGDWGDIVTTTDSDDNPQRIYQLTAEGIEAFRPKAALDYRQENPSDSDVQDYANQIWQSCIETFANSDAFGPDWESLPQFQTYDPAYQFIASEETIANIRASFQESFNLFSYLSSQALENPAVAAAIAKVANIQAGNLILKSSGSIGEDRSAVDIPLEHFQNNTLTDVERQIVRFASQAGEIQLIGKNASGETIYYDAYSQPNNVTLTSVRVKISRPLLVQLASSGSLTATSSSELLVASTSGDLNIKSANSTSNGLVWLESAGKLLVADGSTGTTVTGGNMRLDAGQTIGSNAQPLVLSASGMVDVSSVGDASIKSASKLNVGQWDVGGNLTLQSNGTGAITDALASQRSSFAGFNTNGAGWTTTASQSSSIAGGTFVQGFSNFVPKDPSYSSAITSSQIQLTNGSSNVTRAAWLKDQIPTNDNFTIQFTYEASGNKQADGVALVFQTQGTNVVGVGVGGLGYTRIAGRKAAYQINISNVHTIGSNFVTTDSAGAYSATGSVNFASGHQIQVTLTYDVQKNTITETLKDLSTNATYTKTYSNINLASVLGAPQAYIGFTGASGEATAIQNISSFSAQFTEPATGAAVTSSNSDDQLTVTLQSAKNSTVTWPSQVVFAKNDSVNLSNHFALGFLYQSSAVGSRIALNLGNADQQGLALVLNLGSADGTDAWVDFVKSSEITTATSGQSIGSVLLNSDHPIQVTITYSMLTQTVVASLIDTVTKQAIAIEKTGVNITQRLGSAAGKIAFSVLGNGATFSTHSIRGFRLIDGAVNLVAKSLNVVAGGAFGTIVNSSTNQPENPILVLIDGKAQITAGGAIVAEQVVGDLEVGVISSPTTIEVSAPFGMIVQAPSGGSGGEGETTLQGVMGPNVSIAALLGVGTADGKLMVTTDHLSATTSMNDLELQHQSHTENGVAEIANLIAGGTVRLRTNSDVSVTGRVMGQSAEFHSYYPGKAVRLALKDLEHILGGSLGIVLGGFESLHLDDTQASEAHAIQVSSGIVESHTAKITTGVVRTLAMSLGLGDDKVSVLDASGLSALSIDGQDGHDSVFLANAALAISQVHFNGSLGDDALNVDLRNTGVWITKGKLETAYGVIQYHDLAKFILNRLEEPGHPEAIEKIEQIAEEFPDDRLMVVGTIGMDFLAMNSLSSDILLQANWNAQTSERRTYSKSRIRDVQIYLLGGDDSISVIGTAPVALDIHGGMGNDWIFVQSLSATITDMHGDNVITTGPGDDVIHTGTGNDQIDAGPGKNQIRDEGGLNAITTGHEDDKIWHANAGDWIIAYEGTNDIWLQGVHQDWHNQNNPMDVTRDGQVSFLDALVLINKISRTGPGVLQGSADSVQYLYDVTGDNHITPLDALRIINWIHRNRNGEGESLSDEGSPWIGSQVDGVSLGQTSDVRDGSNGSNPDNFKNVNGTLYLRANDGVAGEELWKSDGTETGTVMVVDFTGDSGSNDPGPWTEIDGKLFVAAWTAAYGRELFIASDNVPGVSLLNRTLSIVGTEARDRVSLRFNARRNELTVDARLNRYGRTDDALGGRVNITQTFQASSIDRIVAFLRGGNDAYYGGDVSSSTPQFVFGEAGNDDIRGGRGSDVLVGGSGNDCISGSTGRDILIGGIGEDHLYGGRDNDLLIGSSAGNEGGFDALDAALTDWVNGDIDAALATLGAIMDDEERDWLRGNWGIDELIGGVGDWLRQ